MIQFKNIQQFSKINHTGQLGFCDPIETPYNLPMEKAIYGFFWVGDLTALKEKSFSVVGPGGNHITLQWQKKWWNTHQAMPLYVGKTTRLKTRITQHLYLTVENWFAPRKGERVAEKYEKWKAEENQILKWTTSCQFRAGMEHLFKSNDPSLVMKMIQENVELRYCLFPEQDGNQKREDISERFYLEDLLIGYYRPWFNLDSER